MSLTLCRHCILLGIRLAVEILAILILCMLRPGVLVEVLSFAMLVLVSPRGQLEVPFVTMLFMLLPGGPVQSQHSHLAMAFL